MSARGRTPTFIRGSPSRPLVLWTMLNRSGPRKELLHGEAMTEDGQGVHPMQADRRPLQVVLGEEGMEPRMVPLEALRAGSDLALGSKEVKDRPSNLGSRDFIRFVPSKRRWGPLEKRDRRGKEEAREMAPSQLSHRRWRSFCGHPHLKLCSNKPQIIFKQTPTTSSSSSVWSCSLPNGPLVLQDGPFQTESLLSPVGTFALNKNAPLVKKKKKNKKTTRHATT